METIYRDYAPKGVKFYFIYKSLAHPETNGYITPFTLDERLMHVKVAERSLGSEIPWICDTMENDLKHALGDAPNSEFIIDPQGNIAVRRSWSKPSELRSDLERLVGAVEVPTTIADLGMKPIQPPQVAKQGVVPRVKTPGQMQALKIDPGMASLEPFYVKLRAEAERSVTKSGSGKLYLGFHLDPLYDVHWNNLAAPLRFEIKASSDTTISPSSGEAPRIEIESDADPREFLLDIDAGSGNRSFDVTVNYFACNDKEGWCKPITQHYTVHLEADRDGGNARRGGPPSRRGNRPGRPNIAGGPGGGNRLMGMVFDIDVEARVLTLRTRDGKERQVVVPADATIRRDSRPIKFVELQRRDRVIMELDARNNEGEDRDVAKRLMVRGN